MSLLPPGGYSPMCLRTARLELRPLRADDLDRVTTLSADPRVMAAVGGPLSAAESQLWLERQLAHTRDYGYGRYLVTRDRDFIGLVGLSRTDFARGLVPAVEVAWRLAFAHWSRGYATEAAQAAIEQGFTSFDLPEVIAVTSVDNTRSRRVMDRLGMRHSPNEDFDHPFLPAVDPRRRHVLYRLRRPAPSTEGSLDW